MPQLSLAFPEGAAASARSAWRWWTGELAGLLPPGWPRRRHEARSDIIPGKTDLTIERVLGDSGERFVETVPIEALDADGWAELAGIVEGTALKLILRPPFFAYALTVTLPKAARVHLRSALEFQLKERSPLELSHIVWAHSPAVIDGDQLKTTVIMARRARAEEFVRLFEDHGFPAPAVVGQVGELALELVPARQPERHRDDGLLVHPVLLIAGLLASIPLSILLIGSLLLWQGERRIVALEELTAPRLKLERQARARERTREALAPVMRLPPVSGTVEEMAGRLPAAAHLSALGRQADGTLEFTVDTTEPDLVRSSFEDAAAFPRLRELSREEGEEGEARIAFASAAS